MGGLREVLPRRGWAVVLGLLSVAALAFFVPPALLGLTGTAHVLVVSAVELACVVGVAAAFLHYRRGADPDSEADREADDWQFDP